MTPRKLAAALAMILAGPVAAQAEQPVGMVENPCPPPLPVPESVRQFQAAFLEPGPADLPKMIALTQQPEFVAHEAERKARAAKDWAGLCTYRAENAALLAQGRRPRIVFIGDSITENWVKADPELFGPDRVGRGIGGQTSGQMLVRFRADVVALKPQVVQIMAGTNDVAGNGGPTSARAYRHNIISMVEIAQANGIRVVLASIPPADRFIWAPGLQPSAQIRELNAWLKAYAAEKGLGFVDYHAVLADPDGALRQDFGIDRVHPNRAGYAAMRELALSVR